jgi:Fic family protein
MKASALKLISPDYFKQYSRRSRLDLTSTLKSSLKKFSIKDFDFYLVTSSVFSSNIEGNRLDLNSFYRNRDGLFKKKEVREIENLVSAYKFASKNKLSKENFMEAHKILSKTLVPFFSRGKFRDTPIVVVDSRTNSIVYSAINWEFVERKMNQLFRDINYLLSSKLSNKEVFYYASMIHVWVAKIHPFRDGNGRSARLLEKWFLASKLGMPAWSITSERYYWTHHREYYKNIALGTSYDRLDWDTCIPFLLMLPKSLHKNRY